MIGQLSGKISACFDDYVIINVADVGYLVYLSAKALHNIVAGQYYQLFVEMHVREQHIHLYGFLSIQEKQAFNLLQSISGVGPKMALSILSNFSPEDIQLIINSKDKEAFRVVCGVGPKLAERIIIELKGKIMFHAHSLSNDVPSIKSFEKERDAISALTNLGINKMQAQNFVYDILRQDHDISIDNIIKRALNMRHND